MAATDPVSDKSVTSTLAGGKPFSTETNAPTSSDGVEHSLNPLASLSSADFLSYLQRVGVDVRANEGKIQLNAPAGVLTPELQSELRGRKPELLLLLSSTSADGDEQVAPLTFAQQRLWLLDRFSPEAVTYNIPQSWTIEYQLDLNVLRTALEKLTRRHAALRTAIDLRNGEPMQIIQKQVDLPLMYTDLYKDGAELSNEGAIQAKVRDLLIEDGRKAFPLSRGPLIRFHVIRVAAERTVFSYCVHHIVADQWSLEILKRDLTALYIETISGQPASLRRLLSTYAEFAKRERGEASLGVHQLQLQYWRQRLASMPPVLELPFAESRATEQNDAGATLEIAIGAMTTQRLRDLAARNHTSLYMLMLAVFQVLLYRYTGQDDICVGTPITGRKRREDEDVIGMFVNMLPLRASLMPSESFEDFLKRSSRAVLLDFEHSDIPFQRLVTELQPDRSSAHSPIFQFLFALNPQASLPVDAQQETYIGTAKFDLSLQIAERPDALDIYIEYRTSLYASEDIEQFGRHFIQLATSASDRPQEPIHALTTLTPLDQELSAHWNQTELAYDHQATLVSLMLDQFHAHPNAVALLYEGQSWTFAQIEQSVHQLATLLQSRGCGQGTYVAVCLDRTPDLIVSILAILFTGAAYLPLDSKYPKERLEYMLSDSGASFLITSRTELSTQLATASPGVEMLFADAQPRVADNCPSATFVDRSRIPKASDPAYLIYTSGSTGQPKGVIVEHGNAVALIAWARDHFAPEILRGVLASTSVCFDLSIFELFVPLTTGNTVILVNDVLELARSPHAEQVTLLNTVPSAMSALLQAHLPGNIQAVCLAGEFLPTELVDRIYAAGVPQVFDLYGPTETTTYSTCTLRLPGATATIGRPIANTRIYLLDKNLAELPQGSVGEIFIGGAGVTRGYLHRAELTSDRYLTLPAIEAPGNQRHGRLYRTGDLARRRRDGELIYLGRRDQQIKLRGHRIELGEIESALREVSHAGELAVVVQKRESGDALIAFVVQSTSSPSSPDSWMDGLRRQLPPFMLPSQIILLDSMPHTPNGKIDRKALSHSNLATIACAKPVLAPADLLEQWVANVWAHRLGRSVARNQHFFDDLGGHSLVAFEIFAEIERRLGVAMMLATLFQAPTVQLHAAAIRRMPHDSPEHLELIRPGLSEWISYHMPAVSSLEGSVGDHANSENRVMGLRRIHETAAIEIWTQEIAAFEVTKPPLRLIASRGEAKHAKLLAQSLAGAGFSRVDIRIDAD